MPATYEIMNLEERIKSFALLGESLRNALNNSSGTGHDQLLLNKLIDNQYKINPWFTPENVRKALTAIARELTEENLIKWTDFYPGLTKETNPSKIGVIMAGNIPLVGFHDFLSVLISGNIVIAKTSSKDSELIKYLGNVLCSINPGFTNRIVFTEGILNRF